MIRVAIVDDEKAVMQEFEQYLNRFAEEEKVTFEISTFSDGAKLIGNYRPVWDLLLLDIEMPVMNGFLVAQQIRQMDAEVTIMFITNLTQYAIKGYEVDALDYVLKPVNYYAFAMKMKKALRKLEGKNQGFRMLKEGENVIKVALSKIYYIEVFDHRLCYHTASGDYTTTGSLAKLEKELSGQGFLRVHSGYLVNIRYVEGLTANMIRVKEKELPLSRLRHKEVMDAMLNYARGK